MAPQPRLGVRKSLLGYLMLDRAAAGLLRADQLGNGPIHVVPIEQLPNPTVDRLHKEFFADVHRPRMTSQRRRARCEGSRDASVVRVGPKGLALHLPLTDSAPDQAPHQTRAAGSSTSTAFGLARTRKPTAIRLGPPLRPAIEDRVQEAQRLLRLRAHPAGQGRLGSP